MIKELFDKWASSYNESIQKSEEEKMYPFYGYGKIQHYIYEVANVIDNSNILEMGIGTGLMTKKLYDCNHKITGVDFSSKMILEAKKIMPFNRYIKSDFISSIDLLESEQFDTIIFSYSIHHLKPEDQVDILKKLSGNLAKKGIIIIGDVITRTNEDMKVLAKNNDKIWDYEEFYPTFEEYNKNNLKSLYTVEFKRITFCSGIILLRNKE